MRTAISAAVILLVLAGIPHGQVGQAPSDFTLSYRNQLSSFSELEGEPEWAGIPEITPVWILEREGDSASVIHNEFGMSSTDHPSKQEFPLPYLIVIRRLPRENPVRFLTTVEQNGLVRIRKDGTLETGIVEWVPIEKERPGPPVVGLSRSKMMTVLSEGGKTKLRMKDGLIAPELPLEVDWAACNDMARTVTLGQSQRVEAGENAVELERVILLDYEGNELWDSGWTDCEMSRLIPGIDRRVVSWHYKDCVEAGYYVSLLDTGREIGLGVLPGGVSSFASDGTSAVFWHNNTLRAYAVNDSGPASLVWKKHFPDRLIDAAVSEWPGIVCYGTQESGPYYADVRAVSAMGGKPLARMLSSHGASLHWPMGFVGPYLFTGTRLNVPPSPADVKYICVFDTREISGGGQ